MVERKRRNERLLLWAIPGNRPTSQYSVAAGLRPRAGINMRDAAWSHVVEVQRVTRCLASQFELNLFLSGIETDDAEAADLPGAGRFALARRRSTGFAVLPLGGQHGTESGQVGLGGLSRC